MTLLDEQSGENTLGVWRHSPAKDQALVRVLLDSEETEALMDSLQKQFSNLEGFRLVLLAAEATLPRPEPPEEEQSEEATPDGAEEEDAGRGTARISREELYADISETARFSWVYIVLVVLSAIVAAVGLMRSNVAVIIGAMVIAPLLGPNVALSLATALGDLDLARRAIGVNAVGLLVALVVSVIAGLALVITPEVPEIAVRTQVGVGDLVLALASGGAGALSFTMGLSTAVIGVMVAVALLPPLVALGMLLGAGHWDASVGALLLLLTNIICVNLAGVITFLVQGIRPATWWEAQKAKRATRRALSIWIALLAILVIVILLSQRG